jgi:uncharacterized protein (TIGR02145 family)
MFMPRKPSIVLSSALIIGAILFIGCGGDDPASSSAKVPTVTTLAVSEITPISAQCGGTVSADGGADVTARGVCWSTDPNPTVAGNKTTNGTGTGGFTSSLSGLSPSTDYYVRAYATNGAGTGYGEAEPFTTGDEEPTGTVTDIDGNVYQTIKIGDQWWMAENLKTTHYRNGVTIPEVTDAGTWAGLSSGAHCHYDFDVVNADVYGRLYNWFAASSSNNIAPTGWHVPSDAEWKQLEIYLGMSSAAADSLSWRGVTEGGKLKETGISHWYNPNTGATNESGFLALPAGFCGYDGDFNTSVGGYAYFWATTEFVSYDNSSAYGRELCFGYAQINRGGFVKQNGFSIRCVKD